MDKEVFSKDKKVVWTLRYVMLIPMVLMMASVVSACLSYADARRSIAEDLNEAVYMLARENGGLWTRQDTIAAIRKMHETTHGPLIYQADDVAFRHEILKNDAYFTLTLVDGGGFSRSITGNKILSDSVVLVPGDAAGGVAVQVQGFASCSMASVFAASDQTVSGVFFLLSAVSMMWMLVWRRKPGDKLLVALSGVRLTPMQRQFTQMLLDAPGRKVDKATLCAVLWGNKSNAEESLYTLVRRTKAALTDAGVEIVCHRGDSYELRRRE